MLRTFLAATHAFAWLHGILTACIRKGKPRDEGPEKFFRML